MKNVFIGCFNKSVILTHLGILCTIVGIASINQLSNKYAMIFLILAGTCDLFDGFIARKCKRTEIQKEFGKQIDSLADIVNFGVFPILIVSSYCDSIITILVGIVYIICSITRLAWFNMHSNSETSIQYFNGVPITYISILLPLEFVFFVQLSIFREIIVASMLIFAITMILNIRIPKPRGIWYIIFPLISTLTITRLLVMNI